MESAKNFNLMQALKENAIYLVLLVLLMVIGLHEGGHWLAMRTLGYRNLSVLFI